MRHLSSRDLSALSASLLLAMTLVLPAAVLYGRNTAEFTFRAGPLFASLALIALVICLLLYSCQRLIRRSSAFVLTNALIIGASFSLWLRMPLHTYLLGRNDTLISSFDPNMLNAVVLEALVMVLPLVVAWRFRQWVSLNAWRIAGAAICTQLVPLISPALMRPQSASQHFEYTVGEGQKFAFGSQDNVIVVVVDCLGEQLFKETVNEYEELSELFKDFVCFDRMTSPIPSTQFAVPAMLTGMEYPPENGRDLDDKHSRYLKQAFSADTSLFVALKKAGYRCEGYPYVLQTISYDPALLDNAVRLSSHSQSRRTLLDVWMATTTPYFLQPLLGNAYFSVTDRFVTPGEYTMGRVFDSHDSAIYRRIQAEARVGEDPKVFKYIHLQGPHVPIATDEYLEPNLETSRIRQLRGSMLILEFLLEKLQEFGLYDQSLLIITGDHSERYTPEVATLIKRPGAKGPTLSYNAVPCTITDINHTVRAELGLAPADESLFSREPVPSSGTRELPPPVIWPVKEWTSQRDPAPTKPYAALQNNFVIRDGQFFLAKKEHMAYNQAIVHFIFQNFADTDARWSSPELLVDPSARSEYYHIVFPPEAPNGIYQLFQRVKTPAEVIGPQSDEAGDYAIPATDAVETLCLPRYIWLKNGAFTLHRRHPTLDRIDLMPGVTAEFGLMQPVPQVDYSNDCRLDGQGLRLHGDSWLGIHLPDNTAGMTLRLQTAIPATGQMVLTVKAGNDVIHKQSVSNKNGTAHDVAFTVPPGPFTNGMLKLSFKVKPRFKNRSVRKEVPVQLKSIALSVNATE
ncbi:sulfatase-like hydrolase/transferase [Oligosphaera ethanolica]|uniref:Sulfatase N-terminal domain-containing protein n=1 Tax=Oligosphaera ethanolica TaxID=760260 RepID=A0AAE3VGE2_9BACT|nr:sulfatase-like hydrolase/transferase [Oligosphaera ethanolica]MDQ0290054.1 hypothetical protein [Oligosphaera ethanolica]